MPLRLQAVFSCYAAAFGLLFLISGHPWCSGPDRVRLLTADQFYSTCVHGGSSSSVERDDVTYVVYFYTDWSAKWVWLQPVRRMRETWLLL